MREGGGGGKWSAGVAWLPRRRVRIERSEAEASSDAIARDWGLVALAVARRIGRRRDVDPLIRLAMNAVLVPDREGAAARKPAISASAPRAHRQAAPLACNQPPSKADLRQDCAGRRPGCAFRFHPSPRRARHAALALSRPLFPGSGPRAQ